MALLASSQASAHHWTSSDCFTPEMHLGQGQRKVIAVPRLSETSPEPIDLIARDPSDLDVDESMLFAPRHDPLGIVIEPVVEDSGRS